MPRLLSAISLATFRTRLIQATAPVLVMAVCAGLLLGKPAFAQGDEPSVEPPAEEEIATEAPPPPTDVPPPPPTDQPPPDPTEEPVIVEPTIAPADLPVLPTDPPLVPTTELPATASIDEPTSVPDATETPSPTPLPTATPTPTPEPALAAILADAPECQTAPDGPAAIASGGSLDYLCTDRIALMGTNVVPARIEIEWTVGATVNNGWSVQILPPARTSSDAVQWTVEGAAEAGFVFDLPSPASVSVMPGAVDMTAEITFRVRIHRPACALEPPTLALRHDVSVQSPDATAADDPAISEPLRLTPNFAAAPEPAVAFVGPLDFGEIGVTAAAGNTVKPGTLSLTVAGLDGACGAWLVQVSASALANQSGAPLAGSRLMLVSINDDIIPNGGCDLAGGCDLMSLAAGPEAPTTRTFALGIELHMPQQPGTGSFTTSIDALLQPAANS